MNGLLEVNRILEQEVFRLAKEKSDEIAKKDKKANDDEPFVFEQDFFDTSEDSDEMYRLQWMARIMNMCSDNYLEFNQMWRNTDVVELYEYYSVKMALYVMQDN